MNFDEFGWIWHVCDRQKNSFSFLLCNVNPGHCRLPSVAEPDFGPAVDLADDLNAAAGRRDLWGSGHAVHQGIRLLEDASPGYAVYPGQEGLIGSP